MTSPLRVPPALRAIAPALAVGATLCAAAAPARAQLVAARIDPAGAEALVPAGLDAIGGLGDWALQNGTLCAVVADPSHESDLSTRGGGLVDLGLCGRADDQFLLAQVLLDNRLDRPVPVRELRAEQGDRAARLVAVGGPDGLRVETRYELDLEVPRRLRVVTSVQREPGPAPALSGLGVAVANVRSLAPFSLSTRAPARSRGYVHPSFAGGGASALSAAASPVDVVVAVGGAGLEPGIAYGQRFVAARLERPARPDLALPHFFFVDALATTLAVFPRPFWWGDGTELGWPQLVQTRFMGLAVGDRLVIEQEIWVGGRADVASVTDLLFPDAPLLSGRVDEPAARVHVDRADGSPFTEVRPDAEGRFSVRAPAGELLVRARAPGGRASERRVLVGAAGADLGVLSVGAPARLWLPRGGPMRLVFVGEQGTPTPDLADDLRGAAFVGDGGPVRPAHPVPEVQLDGTPRDPASVTVPPGRYRVFATRGPEFSLAETRVAVGPGETVALALEPPLRELETPGWIGADLHVHSGASLDTPLAPAARLTSFVAQGGEVLVSTEHENVYDFAPLVRELGLEGRVVTLTGLEVTSEVATAVAPHTIGHANAFPVPRAPLAYRRGAVADEGRRWRDVIADLRALPGERVIQLNHARFDAPGLERRAYFSHLGPASAPFDPTRPLSEPPNAVLVERDPATGVRDLDFDALELLNGEHLPAYLRLRSDWFALLRQGERLVGTANSDSHFLHQVVAAPRNYVRVDDDSVAGLDVAAFVAALRAGRCFGSNGPLLEVALGDAGLGDTYRGSEGRLHGRVRAASWVPVSELRVFVNGEPVHDQPIARNRSFSVPLRFAGDAFVTVEVRGVPDARWSAVLPGHTPLAFSNPIWVDADGDGAWTPPGPSAAPGALRARK